MTDISELRERVEKATGPDRELDEALRVHFRYPPKPWNYTASIDAALALVERVRPGCWYVMAKGRLTDAEPLYGCELLRGGTDEQLAISEGHTQPVAILSALLLSLQSEADK